VDAAFFDLDKTVIAKASMVAFGKPMRRAGLISRRLLVRALWSHLVYLQVGADEARMQRMQASVLRLTKGWDQATVSEVVKEALEDVIVPIVYDEALDLIRTHQEAGRKVFIVSASPIEVVAPLAHFLGVDDAIATRARLDADGRYSGDVEFYSYGPHKVEAMLELATRHDLDLGRSWAYSDSITDLPMLEAVGRPVAVNPDRELQRVAHERQWEVLEFGREVSLRDRMPMPTAGQTAAGAASVMGAAALGVAGWWWRHRPER
jgi:HAD superfamily hydrolase (TIGR01490 family)